jgi:ABC-type phosphate transport system substrate-binding protein
MAVAALVAAMLLMPGSASAACTGKNIEGRGASLQAPAQQIWTAAFDAKCAATEQVAYVFTNSLEALESWGAGNPLKFKGFGKENAFIATDWPPTRAQESAMASYAVPTGPPPYDPEVMMIPVAQEAIALPIHLPTGCFALSGKGAKTVGRLVLSDVQLEEIFAGQITTWTNLTGYNEDRLVGESCNSPIKRVVREEGAGTTWILKNFLYQINGSPLPTETWRQLSETSQGLMWPNQATDPVTKASKEPAVAALVASTPGTIGYAGLSAVRSNAAFTPAGGGGNGKSIFWAELQNNGNKFADPSTNGEENARASANCKSERYIALSGGTVPPPVGSWGAGNWNEVSASISQKKYALCGLTYDLTACQRGWFGPIGQPESETAMDYLKYVLEPTAQAALSGIDYLGLASSSPSILKAAKLVNIRC